MPIAQQAADTRTCWAAVATMLASWKAGRTLTPEEALKLARDQYITMWTAGPGMPAKKKNAFLAGMGIVPRQAIQKLPSVRVRPVDKHIRSAVGDDGLGRTLVLLTPR